MEEEENSQELQGHTPGQYKYWSELTIEGKIERIRTIIKNDNIKFEKLSDDFLKLQDLFESHGHNSKEEITIQIKNFINKENSSWSQSYALSDSEETYF